MACLLSACATTNRQRAKVARTFQNIRLFPRMTVLENLIVAQHNTLMRASGWTVLGLVGAPAYRTAEAAAVERAKYWLDKIALIDRADDPAGDLPYGAQRRLEIAPSNVHPSRNFCAWTSRRRLTRASRPPHAFLVARPSTAPHPADRARHVRVMESPPRRPGVRAKISDGPPDHVRTTPK